MTTCEPLLVTDIAAAPSLRVRGPSMIFPSRPIRSPRIPPGYPSSQTIRYEVPVQTTLFREKTLGRRMPSRSSTSPSRVTRVARRSYPPVCPSIQTKR